MKGIKNGKGVECCNFKECSQGGPKVIFDQCLKAIEEMSYVDTCGKGILRST